MKHLGVKIVFGLVFVPVLLLVLKRWGRRHGKVSSVPLACQRQRLARKRFQKSLEAKRQPLLSIRRQKSAPNLSAVHGGEENPVQTLFTSVSSSSLTSNGCCVGDRRRLDWATVGREIHGGAPVQGQTVCSLQTRSPTGVDDDSRLGEVGAHHSGDGTTLSDDVANGQDACHGPEAIKPRLSRMQELRQRELDSRVASSSTRSRLGDEDREPTEDKPVEHELHASETSTRPGEARRVLAVDDRRSDGALKIDQAEQRHDGIGKKGRGFSTESNVALARQDEEIRVRPGDPTAFRAGPRDDLEKNDVPDGFRWLQVDNQVSAVEVQLQGLQLRRNGAKSRVETWASANHVTGNVWRIGETSSAKVSKAGSCSVRTAEVEDIYCDDDDLVGDAPNMRLQDNRREGEVHPFAVGFAHGDAGCRRPVLQDQESILSMDAASVGPLSLRSNLAEDVAEADADDRPAPSAS